MTKYIMYKGSVFQQS